MVSINDVSDIVEPMAKVLRAKRKDMVRGLEKAKAYIEWHIENPEAPSRSTWPKGTGWSSSSRSP